MPTDTQVRLDVDSGVATVTLDGPGARNALSASTTTGLLTVIQRVAADADVRAVLLTGANGAFTAGADLRQLGAGHDSGAPADLTELLRSGLNPLISALA